MYFIPIQVYETVFQRVCTSVTLDLKSSVVVYKGRSANIQILAHATCFAIIKSILHLLSHFFKGGILQWCCSSMLHDTCWAFSSIRSSAKGLQVSYSKLELTKKLREWIILAFFCEKCLKRQSLNLALHIIVMLISALLWSINELTAAWRVTSNACAVLNTVLIQ